MNTRERTLQQTDPAGSVGSRIYTRVLMAATLGYAIICTLLTSGQIHSVALALAALVAIAGSTTVIVVGSFPERAPLRRATLVFAVVLALVAVILSALGSWTANLTIRDDWGPIAVGLVLLGLGSYRPARELAISGILSALVVGLVVFLEVPFLDTAAPPLAFVIVAVLPLLALCFGGVTYSMSSVAAIESWKYASAEDNRIVAQRLEVGIARAVQHDRVSILSHDVLPFFGEVLERGELTSVDRERAAGIAESIRSVMVAEVDRSWLDGVIELIAPTAVVVDDEHLAAFMGTEGRTALRALIVAITESGDFDSGDLRIHFFSDADLCTGVLTARLAPEISPRVDYAPYFALLRATFWPFDVDVHQADLTVRFSYDRR